MRRFWAFFTLLFSVVLAVGLIGQPILESADISNEFESGSVIQYRISLPESSSETSLRNVDVASQINARLDTAGIRGSSVEIYWPDDSYMQEEATVRISFPTQSQSELASFRRILEGTGELTISTSNTSAEEIMTGDDFFATPVASVEYDTNNAPYVALHVVSQDAWDTMSERADADSDNDGGSSDDDSASSLYIWRGFDPDVDSYDKAFSDDEDVYDATVEDKLLFTIDTSMYNADTRTINIDMDSIWDIDTSRVPWAGDGADKAWDITSARAMVECLNADDYDFDISYTFTSSSPATLSEDSLTWIWVGFVVAYVLLAVGMIVRFGVAGAISSITGAIAVMVTLYIGTALGFEISTAAFVGLAVTAILSLLVNVNYFSRVYSELRKGRDAVKANREGYHKSFAATADICLSALLISLFSFLIGRDLMKVTFGFILIGSVCAFLIGNYITRWLMYWMTTAWKSSSPRAIFGFNKHDARVEEPPLYDASRPQEIVSEAPAKVSRRTKGTIGGLTAAALVLTLACGVTLGTLAGIGSNSDLFDFSGGYAETFTIRFSTLGNAYVSSETGRDVKFTDGNSFTQYLRDQVIEPALGTFAVGDEVQTFDTVDDFLEGTYLSLDNMEFNMVDITNDSGQENDTFTVIYGSYSMPASENSREQEYRTEAVTQVIQSGIESLSDTVSNPAAASNISVARSFVNDDLQERYEPTFSFGTTQPGNRDHSVKFILIGLACMVAFVTVYAGVRFGLAAGVTQLVTSLFGAALGLAVFALLRLPFTAVVGYGLLGGSLLSGVSLFPFLSRNNDILKEHKSYRTAGLLERQKAALDASRLTWLTVGFTAVGSVLFAILSLAMYGSGTALGMGIAFGVTALGSILVGGILGYVMFPVLRAKLSFRTWTERLSAFRAKRNRNRKVIVADPNEAHETVIQGVNEYRSW